MAPPQTKSRPTRPSYDKEALRERWRILGTDPEQSILILIVKACTPTFSRPDFGKTLQSIKANFVQRDYEGIFTEADNLQVYSAAYVPGRALCYYEIFSRPQLIKLLAQSTKVYAVGSGSGSELVSIAAAMTRVPCERQKVQLVMHDIGAWGDVLGQFEARIRTDWKMPVNALTCSYQQSDVLNPENEAQQTELISSADLITFMFVMNELFVNKKGAMALIQSLVGSMKKGAYLLVVESAGSFSYLKVGDKTYMVYTLLDAVKDFECVLSYDSLWYRHPDHLRYSIDIQNMRYFLRLYRKK
ncbi:hypothetical protein BDF14DRAFT_1795289 [Spinellus fusiger]|nr:hypothetical protein BDF14DRAFT_1795289 [Spinellus fusiger]